jgi:hypothetical protein
MKPKTQKKQNVGIVQKFRGYYLEDCECLHCKYYQGRKRGCKLAQCCCDEEKLEAIAADRIKRKRGSVSWDS